MLVAGLLAFALASNSPTAWAQGAGGPSRQVTVFGIVAIPNSSVLDPKLEAIAPQLRRLLPGHGFKLLDVRSKRLATGQAVFCDLGGGASVGTTLLVPEDQNGKVQLRCEILQDGLPQYATIVSTPANQLFFCDKTRADHTRILIGIGAR